ncbi:MAG: ATP-binding cassette domain-containing protein [Actinomycetia bacterium]|nr:ATP-binding cassette domain-containing protein [Actinomycetes bacterium]
MALIEIKHLSFSYPHESSLALTDVSLDVEQGDFALLCGQSGCGKSTLLRHLKTALVPYGRHGGETRFDGRLIAEISQREQSERIGFVSQSPENQTVTDKVWHELAFGLESLGLDKATIRRRVAEMASFFGIQSWYHKSVLELSGGQKQILNLAAVMVMQPDLLILDEPSSQLDPIAAAEFFATLSKINDELGCTILLTEQRLEDVLPLVDMVHVMEAGRLLASATPAKIGKRLLLQNSSMLEALPTPMRVALALEAPDICPVTVRDGRQWLERRQAAVEKGNSSWLLADQEKSGVAVASAGMTTASTVVVPPTAAATATGKLALPTATAVAVSPATKTNPAPAPVVLSMKNAWFRYKKEGVDILQGLSLELIQGELLALVGGNGSGKSTALSVLAGLRRPYRGKVLMDGTRLGKNQQSVMNVAPGTAADTAVKPQAGGLILLPQDPQTLFIQSTVRADLMDMLHHPHSSQAAAAIEAIATRVDIADLLDRHPYDLSGGEQQRAALAKVLLAQPRILLLDEPTKGLDARRKQEFGALLDELRQDGLSVLMVSHDVEFCALFADRCALLFDGDIVSEGTARSFFADNSFYTTAANRMARKLVKGAVVAEDIIGHFNERRSCEKADAA